MSIPTTIVDFIVGLDGSEVEFGKESWLFGTVSDARKGLETNYVLRMSRIFKEDWGIVGVILATNGIGDYLLLLPDQQGSSLRKEIFVVDHEEAMIKLFAPSLECLLTSGPEKWCLSDLHVARLDDDDQLVWWHEES